MFLVEKKKLAKMILKKVYISRGEGGGQGQFGKSLHFEFFFFMTASLRASCHHYWHLSKLGGTVFHFGGSKPKKKACLSHPKLALDEALVSGLPPEILDLPPLEQKCSKNAQFYVILGRIFHCFSATFDPN